MENYKEALVNKFRESIREDQPTELPPSRTTDHRIGLTVDTSPVARPRYRLRIQERKALDKSVGRLVKQGFIKESTSPFNSSIFLSRKRMAR